MAFTIHGLNGHETMSMNRLFKKRSVNKMEEIEAYHTIDPKQHDDSSEVTEKHHQHTGIASETYRKIEHVSDGSQAVFASEIMTSPVETLMQSASIAEAFLLFDKKQFRHVPVISSSKKLVGMVSDRDVLRYMNNTSAHKIDDKVTQVMSSNVISATSDTDLRYVARLFVEERIGSMPIIDGEELSGIITRSDILRAVMRKFNIELWV